MWVPRGFAEFAPNVLVTNGLPAIVLAEDPEWMAALKHATSQARSERPRVPVAVTYAQICEAIRLEPKRAVKLLVGLTWLCAGRTRDCRQLERPDVTVSADRLTVTFRHGKVIKKRGPYSLHTRLGPELQTLLGISDGDNSWVSLLKTAKVNDVLVALRRVDPSLENRHHLLA